MGAQKQQPSEAMVDQTRDGIPILDISAYLAGETGALEALAKGIRSALTNIGFFYITEHPIPSDLIERMFEETERFHALPLERKMKIHLNRSNNGYMPLKGHAQRHSILNKNPKPNENESFFARRERDPEDPDVKAGKDLRDPNQWPENLPGFKSTVQKYMTTMESFQSPAATCLCCRLWYGAQLLRALLQGKRNDSQDDPLSNCLKKRLCGEHIWHRTSYR